MVSMPTLLPSLYGPSRWSYAPFDLDIQATDSSYEVAVHASPAGEARSAAPLEQLTAAPLTPQQLFALLLPDPIRSLYDTSRALSESAQQGLRIRVRAQGTNLAALPWELATDPRSGIPLALSHATPIVRSIAVPQPTRPLAIDGPIRLLAIGASPRDLPALRLDDERACLEVSVANLCRAGLVEMEWLGNATWRALHAALRRGPWHIIHFAGHSGQDVASPMPFVALEDEEQQQFRLSALQLARMAADQQALRLVVLNACHTAATSAHPSLASYLIRAGLPATLAMQREISDGAAIDFSRSFYEALALGLPLEAAVTDARNAVELAGRTEWDVPSLYIRSTSGEIFTRPAQAPKGSHQPAPLRPSSAPTPPPPAPPATAQRPPERLPHPRNPHFVGRTDELATLRTLSTHPGATIVIAGAAGIGKSQLAIEFAYQTSGTELFPGGIFWLDFSDPQQVRREIVACGAAIATNPAYLAALSQEAQIGIVLAELQRSPPCLIIFDGCDDALLLRQWLPRNTASCVLITSRHGFGAWERELQLTHLDLAPRTRPIGGGMLALPPPIQALPPDHSAHERLSTIGRRYAQLRDDHPVDKVARAILDRMALLAPGALLEHDLLLATLDPDPGLSAAAWTRRAADALQRLYDLELIERVTDQRDRWTIYQMHDLIAAFIQHASSGLRAGWREARA